MEKKKQAVAKTPVRMQKDAFEKKTGTEVRWLGNGGAFVNSNGTCMMIDPLLQGFDMPLLVEPPIQAEETPELDAVLITHCDNDHFSIATCKELHAKSFHAPKYVAGLMQENGMDGTGHEIGETFEVGCTKVRLTPADHAWQNEFHVGGREFKMEDFCGFWIETPDCTVWMPGDSRLMEEQLHYAHPDIILMDFSDSKWHITLDGAVKMAAAYPEAVLIPIHWGCVKTDMPEFAGDPQVLRERIVNPERLKELAPGEPFLWKNKN